MKEPIKDTESEFARSAEEGDRNLVVQFWQFLRENKKWWLAPIVITLVIVGVLVALSSTAAAPFIYTLF